MQPHASVSSHANIVFSSPFLLHTFIYFKFFLFCFGFGPVILERLQFFWTAGHGAV